MDRAQLIALAHGTGCAEARGQFVFLCDPKWGINERATLDRLFNEADALGASSADSGWLCLPTGGTTGGLRFARHDERTLGAAVQGFCAHFGIERVDTIGVLPPFHVSGLMARVRSAATGGVYRDWSWKRLEAGERPKVTNTNTVLSLVPTQLERLLKDEACIAWLRQLRIIFLGGGPIWPELAQAAARAELAISLTYGMTETAAMITGLRPSEFAAGRRSSGAALSHAEIEIVDPESGQLLPNGEIGLVRIRGESLFLGYFPASRKTAWFSTEDLGFLDAYGQLNLLGRRDAVIITGGKKVAPLEVENALRASGEFSDVAVIGLPDSSWGEIVVAAHPVQPVAPDSEKVEAALATLPPFKRPKRLVPLAYWPRNEQGKVNRAALRAAIGSTDSNPIR